MGYYEELAGINISTLKHMVESPLHYHHAVTTPSKTSPAKELGTATHAAILEPERFASEYVGAPYFGDLRTAKAKALRDAWEAENFGKRIVAFADFGRLQAMSQAVREHSEARKLLEGIKAEVAIQWTDPETELQCKGRLDGIGDGYILGVKTTKSNNFRSFQRSVEDYGYLWQWSWYHWGWLEAFHQDMQVLEICVESDAPHDVVVYRVMPFELQTGLDEARELLTRVKECLDAGRWPGRCSGIKAFERAPWAGVGQQDDIDLSGVEEAE